MAPVVATNAEGEAAARCNEALPDRRGYFRSFHSQAMAQSSPHSENQNISVVNLNIVSHFLSSMKISLKDQKQNLIMWITEGEFTALSSLLYESLGIDWKGVDPEIWDRVWGKTWMMLRILRSFKLLEIKCFPISICFFFHIIEENKFSANS